MQPCPVLTQAPQTAPRAARSRTASASTIIGSFPPSSTLQGMSRPPACAATRRPVRTEPVNWTMSTASTTASPVPPAPVAIPKTSGAPKSSRQPRTHSAQVSGATSEGLVSTAQPAISAAGVSSIGMVSGQFQRIRVVDHREPFGQLRQMRRPRVIVRQKSRGVFHVVVEDQDAVARLNCRVSARLAGLGLDQVHQPLLVVPEPVAKAAQPDGSARGTGALPFRLRGVSRAGFDGDRV